MIASLAMFCSSYSLHSALFLGFLSNLGFVTVYTLNVTLSRFEQLKSEMTSSSEEHVEAIRHLSLQNDTMSATFKVHMRYSSPSTPLFALLCSALLCSSPLLSSPLLLVYRTLICSSLGDNVSLQ